MTKTLFTGPQELSIMERLKNSQILSNITSVIVEILTNFLGRMGEGVIKFTSRLGKASEKILYLRGVLKDQAFT